MEGKGLCPHGEFDFVTGCPLCIAECRRQAEQAASPQLVKVRYFFETTGELSLKEYTYFSVDRLEEGDIVQVPVKDTVGKARVSSANVPEGSIAAFRDKVKTILAGSKMVATVPPGKPGDDWKTIKPLGPFTNTPDGEGIFVDKPYDPYMAPEDPHGDWATAPKEVTKIVTDAVVTAVIKVDPGKDVAVQALLAEVLRAQEYARDFAIVEAKDVSAAANDLKLLGDVKKRIMEEQKKWVTPIDEKLKSVKSAFSLLLDPLEVANKMLRSKIDAFHNAEKIRLDAAAKAQAALQEAERQEALAAGKPPPAPVAPTTPAEPRKMFRGDIANVSFTKTWKWKAADESLVPREYFMLDSTKIYADVRRGKSIPGIDAWQEESTRVS